MEKIKDFFKEIYHVLRLPEMLILPGNLAFFLFLSLIPSITLIGVITSLFSLSTDTLINFLNINLPSGVSDILLPFVNATSLNASTIFLIVLGFYLSSNGSDSLIIASNILYKVRNENYIFRRIKALFMSFWLILLIIFILIFLAFGNFILSWLVNFSSIFNFIVDNYYVIMILKYFIAFIFILFVIKILYTMAPNINIKSKSVNKGAIFSTITIMFVTSLYSFYVANIAHYDIMYGSLANLAVLIFLIYLISYILVIGIAINHNYYLINVKDK